MRIFLSWACFWVGDFVSHIGVDRWAWGFPIYERLMDWSRDLQSDAQRGPWREVSLAELGIDLDQPE